MIFEDTIKYIFELFTQLFCKHEWYEYNRIETVKNHRDGYTERWYICRKCDKHHILKSYRKRRLRNEI